MAYVRLTGIKDAFGWVREGSITLGALQKNTAYDLLCEAGEKRIVSDARGAWQGKSEGGEVLLLKRSGQLILYNEARLKRDTAQALVSAAPKPQRVAASGSEQAPPSTVPYSIRASAQTAPVDALPALIWPEKAQKLQPFFEKNRPVRLFSAPGWRMVQAKEAGISCCFGYRTSGERITAVLYGVEARGGLRPPKGLQGYRYQRALNGSAYWTLEQEV